MPWHATSSESYSVLRCSDVIIGGGGGGGVGGGGGLVLLPQKRCGDKLKVMFSAKKKRRGGPFLCQLESAECSMLSVEESVPTSPQDARYLLLAKHAGTYSQIRLHAKFVQFAPLAIGDEVMFNFPTGAFFHEVPSEMQTIVTPKTIAVIQHKLAHETNEALSEYEVTVYLPAPELRIASFTVLRCYLYYIKRCADLIMHAV